MVDTAIILAGGLGTRLRSAVPDLPKPLAPIVGRPFLAYQLDYWIAQGVSRFILSVGYLHEQICDYFGSCYRGAALEYVVESTPLGTGGGFFLAVQRLNPQDPFLLLNGDTYFAVDLQQLVTCALNHDADWVFSLFETNDRARYLGLEVTREGRILSLQAQNKGPLLANGGVYWVHPRVISMLTPKLDTRISLEAEVFPLLLASGAQVVGLPSPGLFIDIGVPSDYYRATELFAVQQGERLGACSHS